MDWFLPVACFFPHQKSTPRLFLISYMGTDEIPANKCIALTTLRVICGFIDTLGMFL